MKPIKTRDAEKQLKEKGFKFAHQSGSHVTYKDSSGRTVTLTDTKEQSAGTWRNVAKLAGLKT